jgi:hypothetical protein
MPHKHKDPTEEPIKNQHNLEWITAGCFRVAHGCFKRDKLLDAYLTQARESQIHQTGADHTDPLGGPIAFQPKLDINSINQKHYRSQTPKTRQWQI